MKTSTLVYLLAVGIVGYCGLVYIRAEEGRTVPIIKESNQVKFMDAADLTKASPSISSYAHWPSDLAQSKVVGLAAEVDRIAQRVLVNPPSREFIDSHLTCIGHSEFKKRGRAEDVVFLRWSDSGNDIMFVWVGGPAGRVIIFVNAHGDPKDAIASTREISVMKGIRFVHTGGRLACEMKAELLYAMYFGSMPAFMPREDGWFEHVAKQAAKREPIPATNSTRTGRE